jgi:hypothetical protein
MLKTLMQRRGIVIGTTEEAGFCRVDAEVPLAEMFGYSTDLRSATQGKAEFTMEFARYAPAPGEVTEELLKKYDAADAASREELAQAVENPLADLASVPIEAVWEHGAGSEDGARFALELGPQVPIALGEDWLLISRSLVPLLVHQQGAEEGESSATGLGDVETSLFLKPRDTWLGAAWGLGPILRFPTATDDALGARAWAAGPTAAVTAERGAWSGGAIAHQLWSYAECDDGRVRETLIDPWLNHAWESGFSITLESEALYDWEAEEWTVPVGAVLHQLVELGGQRSRSRAPGAPLRGAHAG